VTTVAAARLCCELLEAILHKLKKRALDNLSPVFTPYDFYTSTGL